MTTSTTAPDAEPTHTWLITLQYPVGTNFGVVTCDGTLTVPPGGTRARAYREIRDWLTQQRPELRDANVLFLSLEPYRL
ncbi:hypothetical protein ACWDD9_10435 [Kitasatospora sp. NPDC001119]